MFLQSGGSSSSPQHGGGDDESSISASPIKIPKDEDETGDGNNNNHNEGNNGNKTAFRPWSPQSRRQQQESEKGEEKIDPYLIRGTFLQGPQFTIEKNTDFLYPDLHDDGDGDDDGSGPTEYISEIRVVLQQDEGMISEANRNVVFEALDRYVIHTCANKKRTLI